MRKHVEWIGNILVTLSRASKPQLSSVAQPFTKFYTWKKDKTLGAVDDANRMSNKGHRVLNSNIRYTLLIGHFHAFFTPQIFKLVENK